MAARRAGKEFAAGKFRWLEAIAADRELHDAACRIAIVLSSYISARTLDAWPSIGTLADRMGMSRSSIKRHLGDMSSRGYLIIKRGGGKETNRYQLSLPAAEPDPAPSCGRGFTGEPSTTPRGFTGEPSTGSVDGAFSSAEGSLVNREGVHMVDHNTFNRTHLVKPYSPLPSEGPQGGDQEVVLRPSSPQLAAWREYERRTFGRARLGLRRPTEWPPSPSGS